MTDKRIIDGKKCRYWFRPNSSDYRKCSLRGENDNCDEIKDCFVKELLGKLALKEQECEELKQWKKGAENLFKAQIDNPDNIINQYKQALDEIRQYRVCEINDVDGEEDDVILGIIDEVMEP